MQAETLEQLNILRRHLVRAFLGYAVLAVLCAVFANPLFVYFSAPLLRQLPQSSLIATQVASPFLIPLKCSLIIAFFIALPWVLYQIWAFIAPGLFPHEKKSWCRLTALSIVLFYAGAAFAYWVTLPITLSFFNQVAPTGVTVLTDIQAYFDFTLALLLGCGFAFQVPLVVLVLLRSQIVTRAQLIAWRPYVIVLAFALGMVLTPPDIFSQTLLAIPLWGLFELGLWLGRGYESCS